MSDGPDTTRVLLTIDEAAERLGICRRTLQDHVKDGAIKYISVGRGMVRRRKLFHPNDIQAFIDAQRTTEWVMPVDMRTANRRRARPSSGPGGTVDDFLATLADRAKARRRASRFQRGKPAEDDFLAERAARVAASRAESEKRNGWAPGTLERRAQKQAAKRRAESAAGRMAK